MLVEVPVARLAAIPPNHQAGAATGHLSKARVCPGLAGPSRTSWATFAPKCAQRDEGREPRRRGGEAPGSPLAVYDLYMSELAMSEARSRFAEVLDVAIAGEPVYVTRRGRRVAVLVDAASYDALVEAVEAALDHAELAAARAEDDYVPWEEVKADLGLR